MTIFHLISSSGFYGAEAMVVTLAEAQAREGHKVVVGAFQNSHDIHTEVLQCAKSRGLLVETVLCSGRWDPDVQKRLLLLCDRHGVELVHTHGYKADFYAKAAADRAGLPVVATCHGWPSSRPIMHAYALLDRRMLRRFDRVVAVADPIAVLLRKSGVPDGRIAVICNGVKVSNFESAQPLPRRERNWGDRPVIGFAGRLVEEKGGRLLVRAAQMVVKRHPDAIFAFAGDGPCRTEWEQLSVELGIRTNVEFLGVITNMSEFYASLDVFALPSYDEATPMAILEAEAAGKPVVATKVGGIPTIVTDCETGRLVDSDDAAALAVALLDLLANPKEARSYGAAGRERVRMKFSSETNAARYLELYQRVLAERGLMHRRAS